MPNDETYFVFASLTIDNKSSDQKGAGPASWFCRSFNEFSVRPLAHKPSTQSVLFKTVSASLIKTRAKTKKFMAPKRFQPVHLYYDKKHFIGVESAAFLLTCDALAFWFEWNSYSSWWIRVASSRLILGESALEKYKKMKRKKSRFTLSHGFRWST